MKLHTLISHHSARATLVTGLAALLTGCAAPEPQREARQKIIPYKDPEFEKKINIWFLRMIGLPDFPSTNKWERGIELIKEDKSWRNFYSILHWVTSPTNKLSKNVRITEHQVDFVRKYRYPLDAMAIDSRYGLSKVTLLRAVIPEARDKEAPLSIPDLIFLSEVEEALEGYVKEGKMTSPSYQIHYHHNAPDSPQKK